MADKSHRVIVAYDIVQITFVKKLFVDKVRNHNCGKSFEFLLHCVAEIRAYWVETKPFEIDNPQHHYQTV